MAKHKDKIPGGLADKKKPADFPSTALKQGKKVESEHTSNKAIAQEIAMDHLTEDKKYYKKLKTIEKKDMLQITPDGKQEIVEGKEPLKKDPKRLKSKWSLIKKDLSNLDAIMDLEEEMKPDEEAMQAAAAQMQPQQDPNAAPPQEGEQPEDGEEPQLEESPEDPQIDPSAQQESEMNPDDIDPSQTDEEEDSNPEEEPNHSESEQKIAEALKNEGYSETEIAYIVHGHHAPEVDESKQAKAHATYAMADISADNARKQGEFDLEAKKRQMEIEHGHNQRMKDLEFQHAQMQSPDPDTEKQHKKRMMDLDYDNARAQSPNPEVARQMAMMDVEERKMALEQRKQEMKMELDFKKREMEFKLKHAEEIAKKKLKEKLAEKPAPKQSNKSKDEDDEQE